jgi:formate dehydrogenase major subunit
LAANGAYEEALHLIKERIPLPASIGRVCPHPCEDACRRGLLDDPIRIAWVKRSMGDFDLAGGKPWIPPCAEDTGKTVGIVGGGPYGLSLAYFLRRLGHDVTIYEAMPACGGMLRYGIPEYRLPKVVLQKEIAVIRKMGVHIRRGVRVGKDISFSKIRKSHDAVAVGIGAWVSTGAGTKGEDAAGVYGGIDMLRRTAFGATPNLGDRVAVIGGGNTAMDACRTAIRLGAKEVYSVYRRTKNEMPAERIEINEGEEEGIIFKTLTNPIEIIKDKNGHVAKIKLQIMELGEPDASGRRSPVPVKGKTEMLEVDSVVLAIGQAVDPDIFGKKMPALTRKNGIAYDPETHQTSLKGVFAGGDCGNDKITIAVEAIGDARITSGMIDAYLRGDDVVYNTPYLVKRNDITEKTYEDRERICRTARNAVPPEVRTQNFGEILDGFSPEVSAKESQRCLECGCGDFFECKLFEYANLYGVHPERFAGEVSVTDAEGRPAAPDATDDGHPYIIREEGKCILCGLCVRICDQVEGASALGLAGRGFDTAVKPAFAVSLAASGCTSCGQCVAVCPTGALQERLALKKPVPLETTKTEMVCKLCKDACKVVVETRGRLLVKIDPARDANGTPGKICMAAKFGIVDVIAQESHVL